MVLWLSKLANLQDLCIPLRKRVVPFGAFVDVGAMAPQRSIRWKSGIGGTDVFSVPTIFSPYNHHAWMMLECVFLLASSWRDVWHKCWFTWKTVVSDDFRMSFSQKPSVMLSDVVPCSSRLRHKGSNAREFANEKYIKIFLHLQVDIQIHINSLCLKLTGTHLSTLFFGVFKAYASLWGFDFSHTHSLLFTCQKATMESLLRKGHLYKTHKLLSSLSIFWTFFPSHPRRLWETTCGMKISDSFAILLLEAPKKFLEWLRPPPLNIGWIIKNWENICEVFPRRMVLYPGMGTSFC